MTKKRKRNKAKGHEGQSLCLKFFDEPQREAVSFALAHLAALALIVPPTVTDTQYFLDRLEHLEGVLMKLPLSETLLLSRRDAMELLSVLSLHLRVLNEGQHPSWVQLPGPEHHLALHAVCEILLLQLEPQARPKEEDRGERSHMDPPRAPSRPVHLLPSQRSRKGTRTWTHD